MVSPSPLLLSIRHRMVTAMTQNRLSSEDWIAAGFCALADGGAAALKVEPIARALGTTKGSFYWHFRDLAQYRTALLAFWHDQATTAIIAEVQSQPDRDSRLRLLVSLASQSPARMGGPAAEPAIRAWACHDSEAACAVARVDDHRLTFLRRELGDPADPATARKARLLYAGHLGLELLSLSTGDTGEALRLQLLDLLMDRPAG